MDTREPHLLAPPPTAEARGPETQAVLLVWAGQPLVTPGDWGRQRRQRGKDADANFSTKIQESWEKPSPRMLQLSGPVPLPEKRLLFPLFWEEWCQGDAHTVHSNPREVSVAQGDLQIGCLE